MIRADDYETRSGVNICYLSIAIDSNVGEFSKYKELMLISKIRIEEYRYVYYYSELL